MVGQKLVYSHELFFSWMSVNNENYQGMLHEMVVPRLQTKLNFDELFFQQDGASLHYVLRVRDYLNKVFHSIGFEEEVALNGHHAYLT